MMRLFSTSALKRRHRVGEDSFLAAKQAAE